MHGLHRSKCQGQRRDFFLLKCIQLGVPELKQKSKVIPKLVQHFGQQLNSTSFKCPIDSFGIRTTHYLIIELTVLHYA